MPLLSDIAARKKCAFFLDPLPKDARILEIGCGSKWVGEYLRKNGWKNYTGLDLVPPADIVGDILQWRSLGLAPQSFDAIIAFELIEHVPCFQECHDLLKPGGTLLLTSPVPEMDWVMLMLEKLKLNQSRTSPHEFLIDFRKAAPHLFHLKQYKRLAGLSQWGVFEKSPVAA
jgi:2-polyprenyl-3-methyl-5-hydroxy-6-metoxy-1,4-benzoquinol methylase